MAKEGITSRSIIDKLEKESYNYCELYRITMDKYNNVKKQYDVLYKKCKPFLDAVEHFPDVVNKFLDTIKNLFQQKEEQEKAIKEKEHEELLKKKEIKKKRKPIKNRER